MRFADKRPERTLGEFILLKLCRERGMQWAAPFLRRRLKPAIVDLQGHSFEAVPGDNLTEGRIWATTTCPEARTIKMLKNAVRDRRTLFLDVGANCGLYSCLVTSAAAEGSKTLAFEPNPVMAKRLRRNVELNQLGDRVDVHEVALGEEEGTASLYVNGYNLGETTLHSNLDRGDGAIDVPVHSLSRYLDSPGQYDLSIIKVDVEGFEDVVLGPLLDDEGASNAKPDLIVLEVDHKSIWTRDIHSQLLQVGYKEVLNTEGNVGLALESGRYA